MDLMNLWRLANLAGDMRQLPPHATQPNDFWVWVVMWGQACDRLRAESDEPIPKKGKKKKGKSVVAGHIRIPVPTPVVIIEIVDEDELGGAT